MIVSCVAQQKERTTQSLLSWREGPSVFLFATEGGNFKREQQADAPAGSG